VGGHYGRCARSAESRGRRLGVVASRLRKRQEPLPPGGWRRKPSARHPGRAGSHLRGGGVREEMERPVEPTAFYRWARWLQVFRMVLAVSVMPASFPCLAQGKERPVQHPTFYRTIQIDGL